MKVTKKDGLLFTTVFWEGVPGAAGYRLYSAGTPRSRTFDPARRSARFSKGQDPYEVEAIKLVPIDRGSTAQQVPDPTPTFKRVAPITVTQEDGSDQRVCLFDASGNLRPGVRRLPSGQYTDESGALYKSDGDGLEDSSIRTKLPTGAFGLATARALDGRSACQCPALGDPAKNTGSWTV